jgi:hypothetical protein
VDNFSASGSALEWSTPRAGLFAAGAGGIALAALAIFATHDPAGMLLLGIAAAGLIFVSVSRLARRPRLAIRPATAAGAACLEVRGLTSVAKYYAGDLEKTQLLSFRRWGRSLPNLEIDLPSGRLLIFGRWDLGTHPQEVLDALEAHGLAVPTKRQQKTRRNFPRIF